MLTSGSILALEKVSSVTANQFILETHVSMLSIKQPVMRFYPGTELNNDPTNWWGPNIAAIYAMLKDVGFKRIELVWRPGLSYRLRQAIRGKIYRRKIERRSFSEIFYENRVVFHAFK